MKVGLGTECTSARLALALNSLSCPEFVSALCCWIWKPIGFSRRHWVCSKFVPVIGHDWRGSQNEGGEALVRLCQVEKYGVNANAIGEESIPSLATLDNSFTCSTPLRWSSLWMPVSVSSAEGYFPLNAAHDKSSGRLWLVFRSLAGFCSSLFYMDEADEDSIPETCIPVYFQLVC